MAQNGSPVKNVGIIKTKQDEDKLIESRDMAEDTTPEAEGGGDPDQSRDADQMMVETGQAPNLGEDEMNTEPVNRGVEHLNEDALEE
jgi:hypothetical protein